MCSDNIIKGGIMILNNLTLHEWSTANQVKNQD